MLYKSISFSDFCDEFRNFARQNTFSYKAMQALYEYLDDIGKDIELDIVSLCCDFNELSYDEIVADYNLDINPEETNEILEYLENQTFIVWYDDNSVLFGVF